MNCLEAQRLIRPFLYRKLTDRQLEQFLDHVENCPDCSEELEIHHTIQIALEDDEASRSPSRGTSVSVLQETVQDRIREARSYLRFRKAAVTSRRTVIVLAELVLAAVIARELGVPVMKVHLPVQVSALTSLFPSGRSDPSDEDIITETTAEKISADEAASTETGTEKISADEAASTETGTEKISADEAASAETGTEKISADEAASAETGTEKAHAQEG